MTRGNTPLLGCTSSWLYSFMSFNIALFCTLHPTQAQEKKVPNISNACSITLITCCGCECDFTKTLNTASSLRPTLTSLTTKPHHGNTQLDSIWYIQYQFAPKTNFFSPIRQIFPNFPQNQTNPKQKKQIFKSSTIGITNEFIKKKPKKNTHTFKH